MDNFKETIRRFFSGSYSEEDLKKLFLWLNSEKGQNEIGRLFDENRLSAYVDEDIPVDSEKMLENIRKGLKHRKSLEIKRTFNRLLPYAAMLILVLGSIFFFSHKKSSDERAFNSRTVTVITQNGQRSQVVLPDSSIVWMNSGTTLTYRDNFSEHRREVILNGEAFFKVAHNEKLPFDVHCNDVVVSVLGTEFDINAYPETGKVCVALESGKVALSHNRIESFDYTLKPGELAAYDLTQNTIHVDEFDVSQYASWKNGMLVFKNEPIKTVFEKLKRWYNIDIEVTDETVYESIFTGTIQSESYEQLFRLIEYSCPVKCRIQHNSDSASLPKVIISKKITC
ncbi:FecR family protein [Anaerorudis cellulosivorans]|uniref:FecR family protein n=1 Tax=Anaerorudis cellulosivorans TaxID=3397862 RepID=UPI0022204A1E|nr:FecR domain-containing protein [Seramator thermalis]MCW1734358.1 FecR domain-containing protein [Seramator thermalis]